MYLYSRLERERLDKDLMKAQRKALKLSQRAVGLAVGRHHTQVARWENGQQRPDLDVLPALARLLQVSLDDLLADPAPMPGLNGEPNGKVAAS